MTTSRWQRAPQVVHRGTLDGLLLRPPDGEVALLSPSAAALWDVLASPHSVDEAAEVLAARTGASDAEIRADLEALVADLAGRGLLESAS